MALRGYPPPPPWTSEKSRTLKDGELFHVISYGRNNMPSHRRQLSQDDRWKTVLYIRDLQHRADPQVAQTAGSTTRPHVPSPGNSSPESGAVPQ